MTDRAGLKRYLRERWDDPDLEVTDFDEVPGGKSKETVLATLTPSGDRPTRIVVRADRSASPLSSKAVDEYAVISAVHDYGGVPVAKPLMFEADPAIFGGTALISERVDGRRPGQFFPELEKPREHGPELMTHFARVLARLHTMPLDRLAGSHLDTAPKPITPELLDKQVLDLADALDKGRGPNVASMQISVDWLRRHLDLVPADTPVGLNHGDIGLHNMLADGGRITALLDWELPHVGPIAYELATVHTAVTSLTTWDAFVAAYLDAGGPSAAVEPGVIAFYRVQKCLWLAWYSRAASQLYWSGARRDIISAGVSFDSQFRHSIKVARAMHDALAVVWP